MENEPFAETEDFPALGAEPAETPPPQPARTSDRGRRASNTTRSGTRNEVRSRAKPRLRVVGDFPPAVTMTSLFLLRMPAMGFGRAQTGVGMERWAILPDSVILDRFGVANVAFERGKAVKGTGRFP